MRRHARDEATRRGDMVRGGAAPRDACLRDRAWVAKGKRPQRVLRRLPCGELVCRRLLPDRSLPIAVMVMIVATMIVIVAVVIISAMYTPMNSAVVAIVSLRLVHR